MYSKIEQWNKLTSDFGNLEDDEELIIKLGDRRYLVTVLNEKELQE